MNKNIIALAVAAATFASQATAVELYNNDGTTFAIGGHVTAAVQGSQEGETKVDQVSPRINIKATQDLGNGFTAEARAEWAMNMLDGAKNTFTTRLGFIGVSHETYGLAVAGTQWAPYYDVAGIADMPIAFANDFIYDNHGKLGTGRADRMISYRNSVDFNSGEFNYALAWQGDNSEKAVLDGLKVTNPSAGTYDDRAHIALSFDVAGFSVGYAYNTGDVDFDTVAGTVDANSHIVSAKYGSYGQGLYVAAVYGMNEYMNFGNGEVLEDSNTYEFIAAYALANSLNLSINYEGVEDNANDMTARNEMALQAEYNVTPKLITFAGYQFDLGDDYNAKDDNKFSVGVRYYL